jgi:hypothetical protein
MASNTEIKISLKCSNGKKVEQIPFTTEPTVLVSAFKEKIADVVGIPASLQMLIFAGHVMKDDRTLDSYGMCWPLPNEAVERLPESFVLFFSHFFLLFSFPPLFLLFYCLILMLFTGIKEGLSIHIVRGKAKSDAPASPSPSAAAPSPSVSLSTPSPAPAPSLSSAPAPAPAPSSAPNPFGALGGGLDLGSMGAFGLNQQSLSQMQEVFFFSLPFSFNSLALMWWFELSNYFSKIIFLKITRSN